MPDLKRLDHVQAPYRDGWTFTAPVIEMPIYLTWMNEPVRARGRHRYPDGVHALPEPKPTSEHPTLIVQLCRHRRAFLEPGSDGHAGSWTGRTGGAVRAR